MKFTITSFTFQQPSALSDTMCCTTSTNADISLTWRSSWTIANVYSACSLFSTSSTNDSYSETNTRTNPMSTSTPFSTSTKISSMKTRHFEPWSKKSLFSTPNSQAQISTCPTSQTNPTNSTRSTARKEKKSRWTFRSCKNCTTTLSKCQHFYQRTTSTIKSFKRMKAILTNNEKSTKFLLSKHWNRVRSKALWKPW